MMGAGRLDTRCEFQQATKVSDGGGGFTTTWAKQFTLSGGFAFPSLRAQQEAIAAGAVQSVTAGTLTVRQNNLSAAITSEWRVVAKGKTWNIREVRPPDGSRYIRMTVEAGTAT